MPQTMRALTYLCLMALSACTSAPEAVPSPPVTVQVPKYIDLPATCFKLQPVELPSGTSTRGVVAAMDRALSRYEEQVKACAASQSEAAARSAP